MRTGDGQGAAHGAGDLVRVVHELDVEGVGTGVDDGVGVERLGGALARLTDMEGVVVHGRVGADEAVQRSGDGWGLDEAAHEGSLLVHLRDRLSVIGHRDSGVEDADGLFVEVVGYDGVHAVEAGRDEARDLDR